MSGEDQKIAKMFPTVTAPAVLLVEIKKKIAQAKIRRAYWRTGAFLIFLALSLYGAFLAVTWIQTSIAGTGLTQYLSLLFSDFGMLSAYWSDFLMSIMETAPIVPLTLLLACAVIFLESIRYLVEDVPMIFRHHLISVFN